MKPSHPAAKGPPQRIKINPFAGAPKLTKVLKQEGHTQKHDVYVHALHKQKYNSLPFDLRRLTDRFLTTIAYGIYGISNSKRYSTIKTPKGVNKTHYNTHEGQVDLAWSIRGNYVIVYEL